MKRSGFSLIELMVSIIIMFVIAGALFAVFKNTYESRDFVVGQGLAEATSRTPIDTMADHLRNSQQYKFGSGTSVGNYKVIESGTRTSVTYYRTDSATDTVRYFLDGTNLKRQEGSGTPVIVLRNVTSLELLYFKTPTTAGGYYNASVAPTTDVHVPASAELPYLKQIEIRANVSVDGFQREMVGLVRLRNSPRKVRL